MESPDLSAENPIDRRSFVATSLAMLGTTSLGMLSARADASPQQGTMTVQDVITVITRHLPNGLSKDTVDTIKAGDPNQVVTGIVTTMFATLSVIETAIAMKANFIIAHEPTFYNHPDQTDWLEKDSVYKYKRDLLVKNGIAVWRCHDTIHQLQPDGVRLGVMNQLDWGKYYDANKPAVFNLPTIALGKLAEHAKQKIGASHVRVCGDLALPCKKIALLPGAAGGRRHITLIQEEKPDVLIVGELQEWETAEYVRDARLAGEKRGLIVLGHSVSEEPGMEWLVGWLGPQLRGVIIRHVPSNDPFTWV